MVITGQQVADAPPGFTNSIKITVGTAQASLGASDAALLITPIEGFRTSRLQMGTASALSFTLGFWTKIHRTGPYSGSVRNSATSRSYPFSFTQNVADTWEYKTVTIPGDVAGTWIGNTNGVGLYLTLTMAAGSTISGTANAWAGSNYAGVTGTTNGVAATTDVFQITGVSLLPGSVAVSAASSPLLKRSVDQELRLCKRYYEPIYFSAALAQAFISCLLTSTFYYHYWQFHVEKRAVPTIGLGTGVWQNANPTGTSATTDGVLFNHGTTYFYISGTASTIAAYADARL
jgi:hypothetical protein